MAEGPSGRDITGLLQNWTQRAPNAEVRLVSAVYSTLRRIAAGYVRRERGEQTLQPTALVHEAYVRLVRHADVGWEGRSHFYGIAARVMRQVLVDRARERCARKRAAVRAPVSVSKLADPAGGRDLDVLALHEALQQLAELDARQAEIVELRYFGGLTENEAAAITGLSAATIRREIAAARFWLGLKMRSLQ
jgi:RNA polymerase sigma factor (TIGR02999 family)